MKMDPARWQQMQDIFHGAVDLSADQQAAFLDAACGEDDALRKSVEAMLSEDDSLLDHDLAGVAQNLLSDAPPPKDFGPYRTLRLLGQGGMGVVYLAEREDLGNLVAIKVLRDAWLHPSRRERFDSERRVLAQLNHSCIARLYDAATFPDGTPWFVMEYVEGISLTEYCRRYKCTLDRKLQLFRTVCEAVQYAHEQAIIHRDLKPSNILVKNDGAIRLLDFGIAKQVDSLEQQIDQTKTIHRMMTPAYASPEQVRGSRISIQTDVYSLGVILFELLTEELPFDLSNLAPDEALSIVAQHDPPKPSVIVRKNSSTDSSSGQFRKAEWPDLDVLCLTAMHKDPERRYRSVEALIRDIDHYRDGEPLEARADSFRYRARKFVRRNRRMVAAASAVVLLLAGVLVYSTIRITRARDEALAEAARTARVQAFMMNLFEGGDETAGPADQLRVVDLVDKGVQEANALNSAPKIQAELYQTLGNINDKLGHLDQADSLLQRSLQQRKALFGSQSPEVAESLVALSQLRTDQARLPEAEKLVREAIAIDAKAFPPNHPARARAITQLGLVLEDRGAYDQAISVLEQAVQMQSAPDGVEADLSASLTELANCHYYSGHYEISDELNHRVLELDRKLYGERHPQIANDLINLGAIQLDEGHYDQAEKYDRQALDIFQSFYGKDNAETASAMTLLGRALVTGGKYEDAASMLQQALATEEHVYGSVHPRIASTLNELGKVAQKQGKLDLAKADFERMAKIYREVYNGKHYYIGIALSNLAGVYVDEKQYNQAEKLFREALQLYSETLPADHLNVGIAKIRLGRVLLRQHDYSKAQAETQAGYDIVQKQSDPPSNWIQSARKDLAEEYTALNQPQKAVEFLSSKTGSSK
ncbi:MAG TPA: serine/threonine-protein kinase [Edaphobacter sp.]|nr:serine/threonine-protein kinase [Edaphobacter sp.]